MIWQHKWPFSSREHALAHEQAYLAGRYSTGRGRSVLLVDRRDLDLERWLEDAGAKQLQENPADVATVRAIWSWKMRATIEAAGGCADAPVGILTDRFAEALAAARDAQDDSDMATAIDSLAAFSGVAIRAASAFVYWLRPHEYQVIDQRATAALNLAFTDQDYTSHNYIRYCVLTRGLAADHELSLRQVDRALFIFQKLLVGREPTRITI